MYFEHAGLNASQIMYIIYLDALNEILDLILTLIYLSVVTFLLILFYTILKKRLK